MKETKPMVSYEVNTLGINYSVQVPASVDEYNKLAPKRSNPVLEDAIDNVWYRGGAAEARDTLYNGVLKAKSTARPKVSINGKDVDAPATRANITALLGDGETLESYGYILEEWATGFEFDPSVAERSSSVTITKAVEVSLKKLIATMGLDGTASKLSTITGKPVAATEDACKQALAELDSKRRDREREAKKTAAAEFAASLGL